MFSLDHIKLCCSHLLLRLLMVICHSHFTWAFPGIPQVKLPHSWNILFVFCDNWLSDFPLLWFLFLCLFYKLIIIVCLFTQLCPTLCDSMDCSPPGSFVHGDSSGKNTGVGCHSFIQGWWITKTKLYTRGNWNENLLQHFGSVI